MMKFLSKMMTGDSLHIPRKIALFVLTLVTIFLFAPTLNYGFVFDDFPTILEYQHIRLMPWAVFFFTSPRWLTRLLHKIGFIIGGLEPFGFRLLNLMLHLSIGLLIYELLRIACERSSSAWVKKRGSSIAFLTAFLFLVHPAQTQTATYITQMSTEGMAAFVALLVTYLFARGITATSWLIKAFWYVTSIAAAFVGSGSKEIIIVLPLLVGLTDLMLFAQGDFKILARRLLLHCLICVATIAGLQYVGVHVIRTASEAPVNVLPQMRGGEMPKTQNDVFIQPNLYRWSQPKILMHYLKIFIIPIDLCFEYSISLVKKAWSLEVLLPLFFWIGLLGLALFALLIKQYLLASFGLLWFFIVMLPRVLLPSQELICDYKTYMGSFGMMILLTLFFIIFAEWLSAKLTVLQQKKTMIAAIAGCCCSLVVMSYTRNLIWRDELTFWTDVTTKVPNRARAFNNLGVAYIVKEDIDAAIVALKRAVEINPLYGEPYVNLAHIYERKGLMAEAAACYDGALASGELHPQLYFNMGLFNRKCEDLQLAEKCLRKALEIRPFYPAARFELACVLFKQKKLDQLVAHYKETAAMQALETYDYNKLVGTAFFEAGDYERALAVLSGCEDQDHKVIFMMGSCFLAKHDYAQAVKYLGLAYKNNRHDVSVAYNLGKALFGVERYQEAFEAFGRCNNVVEQLPDVVVLKAQCLTKLERSLEAKEMLVACLETKNFDSNTKQNISAFLNTI